MHRRSLWAPRMGTGDSRWDSQGLTPRPLPLTRSASYIIIIIILDLKSILPTCSHLCTIARTSSSCQDNAIPGRRQLASAVDKPDPYESYLG